MFSILVYLLFLSKQQCFLTNFVLSAIFCEWFSHLISTLKLKMYKKSANKLKSALFNPSVTTWNNAKNKLKWNWSAITNWLRARVNLIKWNSNAAICCRLWILTCKPFVTSWTNMNIRLSKKTIKKSLQKLWSKSKIETIWLDSPSWLLRLQMS